MSRSRPGGLQEETLQTDCPVGHFEGHPNELGEIDDGDLNVIMEAGIHLFLETFQVELAKRTGVDHEIRPSFLGFFENQVAEPNSGPLDRPG